jgi:alpha-tubulin suppressor-like RCC1 family protein
MSAIFGAGLTKSGALASRHLVMEPTSPTSMTRPLRLGRLNEKKIRKVAAGLGFSLFAASDALYGSGLNNFYQLGGPKRKNEEWVFGYFGGFYICSGDLVKFL